MIIIFLESTSPDMDCIDSIEGLFQFSYEIEKGGKCSRVLGSF